MSKEILRIQMDINELNKLSEKYEDLPTRYYLEPYKEGYHLESTAVVLSSLFTWHNAGGDMERFIDGCDWSIKNAKKEILLSYLEGKVQHFIYEHEDIITFEDFQEWYIEANTLVIENWEYELAYGDDE